MVATLLKEVNPNGNIQAVVESDDDACYFYLFAPHTQLGTKSVWVRNHTRAPEAIEVERMRSGLPHGTPHVTVATPKAELHLLQKICTSSGCQKATVRRSTNETRSWPSFPPGAALKAFTVMPATTSVRAPSPGSLVQTMFCSNASNNRNPTGRNRRPMNSGRRSRHLRSPNLRKYSATMLSTTRSAGGNGRRRRWCAFGGKTARFSSRSA